MRGVEIPERVLARVWGRVERGGKNDCWPCWYSRGSHGYPQIGWQTDGRLYATTAHRVAWVSANGPIPDGLTVDHRCRNVACCNPAHLRLMTNEANAADNAQSRKTHCVHGHKFTKENTGIRRPAGKRRAASRRCRRCEELRYRRPV